MPNPLTVNPTTAVQRLTVGASDWLWVVMVIMGISAVATLGWAKSVRPYSSFADIWSC
jgi:bacteriorhodopsin